MLLFSVVMFSWPSPDKPQMVRLAKINFIGCVATKRPYLYNESAKQFRSKVTNNEPGCHWPPYLLLKSTFQFENDSFRSQIQVAAFVQTDFKLGPGSGIEPCKTVRQNHFGEKRNNYYSNADHTQTQQKTFFSSHCKSKLMSLQHTRINMIKRYTCHLL